MRKSKKTEPRYRNGEDAANRLHRTILRWRNVPVMLTSFDGTLFRVHCLDKADEKSLNDDVLESTQKHKLPYFVVDGNDIRLDVESPPTGYVNIYDKKVASVAFLSRLPVRRYQQGLSVGNTSMVNEYSGLELITGRGDWPCSHKFIGQMMKDDYPTAEKCLDVLQDEDAEGHAFSRSLAFVRAKHNPEILQLHWKSNLVGFVKQAEKQPTVSLLPDWSVHNILKSSLMNAGVYIL